MKYFISEPWFLLRELFTSKKSVKTELQEIHNKGFVVKKNFISKEDCSLLIEEFNKHKGNIKAWRDSVGSDTRLHGIENKVKKFSDIFDNEELNGIYTSYINSSMKSMILCNHVKAVKNNIGSGGGWHRDSIHRRQLKFILYLTDATRENGCFQYIPQSHKTINKFRINKHLKKGYGEYRYTPDDIEKLLQSTEFENIDVVGNAGDLIIVDTSGIHRGSPIIRGERYAATKYMWERKIPQNVKQLIIE